MRIGAHESIAGGPSRSFARAEAHGGEAVQVFTASARSWAAKPPSPEELEAFQAESRRTGLPVICHASYLLNLASDDDALRGRSLDALTGEADRCEALGIPWIVLHPGTHPDRERGLTRISEGLRAVFAGRRAGVLLENTAGQGSSLGCRLEDLSTLLAGLGPDVNAGVCIDTCHLLASGYDVTSAPATRQVLRAIDEAVGLERVHAFHLNDSKKGLGSRVDRHAPIGEGLCGTEVFEVLLNEPRLAGRPGFVELPPSQVDESLDRLRALRRRPGRKG